MLPTTLPHALLSSLSEVLATRIGLHFPKERWGDLERGMVTAAAAFGMANVQSCALRLLSAPLTHREIEILASCLTVGETYFFREHQSFEALEQHILPALLRARAANERRLRIWSAGCCTGEEAYSIAMLLDRLLGNTESWNITILATDINSAFLHKAAAGEYGEWSFRTTPDWIKQRYFHAVKKGRFQLDERIRRRVTFSYLNLADDAYPSLSNNSNAMDVIFCRNVLMYFNTELVRIVVDKLRRALVNGGWLIVSPAEASSSLFSNFTTVAFAGATLYHKDASAQAPRFVRHVSAPEPMPVPNMDSMQDFGRLATAHIPSMEAGLEPRSATIPDADPSDDSPPKAPAQDDLSRAARDCANQGRLDEAAEWCRKAIAADKLNPAHHYLLAVIQREQGLNEDAAQSFLRTLYLDPNYVLAHYALGNLRQTQGREREAQRCFDNTLAGLRAHAPEAILLESDGLTAGRLAEIIVSMRSRGPPSASHR